MKVKIHATLRPIVGSVQVPTDVKPGQSIRELVQDMVTRWPDLRPEMVDDDGNLLGRIHIFVNGRNVRHLKGMDTTIPEDANINIFPPVGGG